MGGGARGAAKAGQSAGLKNFLDTNPLVVAVGIAIAAGCCVAGVMKYSTDQKLELLEIQRRAELLDLQTKGRADLAAATEPLKEKIADLTAKFSSIERRLPGSEAGYVDITKLTISGRMISELDEHFLPFADRRFYVALPQMADWHYEETNEAGLLRRIGLWPGDRQAESADLGALAKLVEKSPVYVWRGKQVMRFQFKPLSDVLGPGPLHLAYAPAVSVQYYDIDMLKERLAFLDKSSNGNGQVGNGEGAADSDKPLQRATDQHTQGEIDALLRQAKLPAPGRPSGGAGGGAAGQAQIKEVGADGNADPASIKPTLDHADAKQSAVSFLASVASDEISSYMLFDSLGRNMFQTANLGIRHKLVSAQQKGNVWYIEDQMTFRGLPIGADAKPAGAERTFTVDEEVFFFGYRTGGVLVRVTLPRIDGMADSVAWTNSWLAGLRIPLD